MRFAVDTKHPKPARCLIKHHSIRSSSTHSDRRRWMEAKSRLHALTAFPSGKETMVLTGWDGRVSEPALMSGRRERLYPYRESNFGRPVLSYPGFFLTCIVLINLYLVLPAGLFDDVPPPKKKKFLSILVSLSWILMGEFLCRFNQMLLITENVVASKSVDLPDFACRDVVAEVGARLYKI